MAEPDLATPYADHLEFQQPADAQAKLWRYCDLPKLVSLLAKRALYFPLVSSLDDQYEARFPRLLAERFPKENRSAFENSRHQMFVSCWHCSEYQSAAMWQLYSRMNEGIAIQSSLERLKCGLVGFEQVPQEIRTHGAQVNVGLVKYLDYERQSFNSLNGFAPALHKRLSFEHEKELRAVCWLPYNYQDWMPEPGPYHRGISVTCDVDRLIEAIFVSPTAPPFFHDVVKAVCERFDLSKPIFQSDLASGPLY